MDHMDWFEPEGTQAPEEIRAMNRAMKLGGRVLLRSAGLRPWYIAAFSAQGFSCERVAARTSGKCIDRCVCPRLRAEEADAGDRGGRRVNMYASTWICTKVGPDPTAAPEEAAVEDELDAGAVEALEL